MKKLTDMTFNRNMFIMLFSIMIGAILITYFAADIIKESKIEDLESQIAYRDEQIQIKEIEIIVEKNRNINFTNNFLKSSGVLDLAREYRANGNYHFELGRLFFIIALNEYNLTRFNSYKNSTIDNCTLAIPDFNNSYNNFHYAGYMYNKTKNYTDYNPLIKLIDNYINLTKSGAKLSMLLYNASNYLKNLANNLSMENGSVKFEGNVTELWKLFNDTLEDIKIAEGEYRDYSDAIDIVKPVDIEDLEYPDLPDFNTER